MPENQDTPIQIGDFIKSKDTGYHGIVTGEGTITTRRWPAWKVEGARGETNAILKSQAIFIAPDWEAELEEKGCITRQ